jgi:integrase
VSATRPKFRKVGRGLSYDKATRTAKLSVYIQGRKGQARLRRTLYDVSIGEAERAIATLRAQANRGVARATAAAPTLRAFYEAYFDLIAEGIAPSTADDYRIVITGQLLRPFGDTRLTDITSGAVNVWLRALKKSRRDQRKRPLSGATLNGYANVLRLLVNYAVTFDVIEESPFKKPLAREKVNLPKNELTDDERAAFFRAFDDRAAFLARVRARHRTGNVVACVRYSTPRPFGGSRRWDGEATAELWERFRALRPFFVVALTTGLRLGDLRRLAWNDVRWSDGWIQLTMEKTKKEVVIPIAAACAAALRECRGRPVVGELVFVDETGAALSETRIRRTFALAKKLAGITRRFRIHDLRHTYGSSLASDGLSLAIIGKVMGHTDQKTTARYARPDDRVLEAVRQSVDRRHVPLK